jgi:hypothetical protein
VGGQPGVGSLGLECGNYGVDLAGQDLQGVAGDPRLGGGVGVGVEAPGRLPQVLQDVDEVDQDVDVDAAACGFRRIRSSWWRAPSTSMIQVRRWVGSRWSAWSKTLAMTCWLVVAIDPVSHLPVATGPGRRRRPPAPSSPRSVVVMLMAGPMTSWGRRGGVVDGSQGRHPLAALLLAAGQPGPVAACTLGGAALRVSSRSASGRMTTPLPSTLSTNRVSSVAGRGTELV